MAGKDSRTDDQSKIFRELASRKLEEERRRAQQINEENTRLRAMAIDLQKKISIANARVAELEKRARLNENDAQKESEQTIERLRHELETARARHQQELQRLTDKHQREIDRIAGSQDAAHLRVADVQAELDAERQGRIEAETRLRELETATRRVSPRAGQVTGYETDLPEDLLQVLAELDPELPLKVLRNAIREVRNAAGAVERAFAKVVKDDASNAEFQAAVEEYRRVSIPPDTEDLPPAPAQMVEEAFQIIADEVHERTRGRQHLVLISAMASELVRLLRNDREKLDRLNRLAEMAESTELATAARLLLRGATTHQQEIAAAKLVEEELRRMKYEAQEGSGRGRKLYTVAETGMAGEWATAAIQAMAALKPLPAPDREAVRRPVYHLVVECAKLVQQRIDSALSLGASAETAVRDADEAFVSLDGMINGIAELVTAARREVLSGIHGEQDVRLKLTAARNALAAQGKRGERAALLFDNALKNNDVTLGQWKATYRLYATLSRDMNRIEGSIEGQMLDLEQPLESEQGKRLYQIIHDLSEHLPEYRSLAIMRQRLFVHLENPKQRILELKHVRESSDRILTALGEPDSRDLSRYYQFTMARLYDLWAALEEVREGTHSELAVTAEFAEPILADVLTWLSSSNIDRLTDGEQAEVMQTAAYVLRLKRFILGIHDRSAAQAQAAGPTTVQFEERLANLKFPPDWDAPLARLGGPERPDLMAKS